MVDYTSVWIVCNYISDVGHHDNGQLPPIATELMKCLRPCDVMGETPHPPLVRPPPTPAFGKL